MKKGEITVFLSLTVVLLVSFILGMMNAANIQLMKNQARIDVDSALYSLFGEYQTDLLEEYHIFGIEETYGTGNLQEENLQEENLLRRMHYFGTKGIVHEIKGIQYLTDLDGMGLREQIITYMEQKYGIEYARNLAGMTGEWEEVEIQEKEAKENQNQSIEEMKQMSEEMEKDHQEEIENPFDCMEQIEANGIISYVLPKDKRLSGKEIKMKLFLIRMGVNYICLQKDSGRKAEAEVLAVTICTLLLMPEGTEVVKQLILAAWAGGESVADLRTLLAGQRVPAIKTSENWSVSLAELPLILSSDKRAEVKETEKGLSYKDYLRILLFLKDTKEVTMRLADRIEENIRSLPEKEYFRIDQCVTKLEIENKVTVYGDISYTFPAYFGYQ